MKQYIPNEVLVAIGNEIESGHQTEGHSSYNCMDYHYLLLANMEEYKYYLSENGDDPGLATLDGLMEVCGDEIRNGNLRHEIFDLIIGIPKQNLVVQGDIIKCFCNELSSRINPDGFITYTDLEEAGFKAIDYEQSEECYWLVNYKGYLLTMKIETIFDGHSDREMMNPLEARLLEKYRSVQIINNYERKLSLLKEFTKDNFLEK